MRRWIGAVLAVLILSGCGQSAEETVDLRQRYHDMAACEMEAEVTCEAQGLEWTGRLRCRYVPEGESVIEILAPEELAGVRGVLSDRDWRLEYEDICLNAGTLSEEEISPALCLPRLMNALRDGWLLEENAEAWEKIPCIRLVVDQSGSRNGKIVSTVWLSREEGTPVRGEIAVDGENILTAEFTSFQFYDTITPDGP